MRKQFIIFGLLCAILFALAGSVSSQSFPRQTDGRDSLAIPGITRRWGVVIVGKGTDDLWHIVMVDSSGNLLSVGPTVKAVYDSTVTATTTQDTIVIKEGKFDYVSISAKESFGYYIGFSSTHDSASSYMPPGCVWNGPVNDDSVFIKMEENTSLISIIGIDY